MAEDAADVGLWTQDSSPDLCGSNISSQSLIKEGAVFAQKDKK